MDQRLRQAERIRRRPEFQRVYDHGVRLSGRLMTVLAAPNTLGHMRLGVVATRRLGNAVIRNRAKRRVREMFRRNKRPAAGVDVVVLTRPSVLEAPLAQLEAEYRSLLDRYDRRRSSGHA